MIRLDILPPHYSTGPIRANSGRTYISAFLFIVTGVVLLFAYVEESGRMQALDKAAADSTNLAWVIETNLNATLRRLDANFIEIGHTAKSNNLRKIDSSAQHATWSTYL